MGGYEAMFADRGAAYDAAMQACPEARRQEFLQLLHRADPQPGHTVADVPAGGGYLNRYLPDECQWLGYEPCESFHASGDTEPTSELLPLPWAPNSVDVAVSLAGVHHMADKRPFFQAVREVVKPGGRFVLSDVTEGSRVARFLDGFVGSHNSTGHDGIYLGRHTLAELDACGWSVASCEQVDFHWVFPDAETMVAFCQRLFDLRSPFDVTRAAIEEQLGIDRLALDQVGMRWSLMTIVANRPWV